MRSWGAHWPSKHGRHVVAPTALCCRLLPPVGSGGRCGAPSVTWPALPVALAERASMHRLCGGLAQHASNLHRKWPAADRADGTAVSPQRSRHGSWPTARPARCSSFKDFDCTIWHRAPSRRRLWTWAEEPREGRRSAASAMPALRTLGASLVLLGLLAGRQAAAEASPTPRPGC